MADTRRTDPGTRPPNPSPEDNPVPVHSVSEEYFYLMVHPCACGGVWATRDQTLGHTDGGLLDTIEAQCAGCGKSQTFRFALRCDPNRATTGPVREINPMPEPSKAIDLIGWMNLGYFYLKRIGQIEDAAERAQSMLDARGCFEEAVKFFGPSDDAPPPEALWSEESRQAVATQPDAFRRATLESVLAKMPAMDRLRKVDAMAERAFRKRVKEAARHRIGRRWWEFWKREK